MCFDRFCVILRTRENFQTDQVNLKYWKSYQTTFRILSLRNFTKSPSTLAQRFLSINTATSKQFHSFQIYARKLRKSKPQLHSIRHQNIPNHNRRFTSQDLEKGQPSRDEHLSRRIPSLISKLHHHRASSHSTKIFQLARNTIETTANRHKYRAKSSLAPYNKSNNSIISKHSTTTTTTSL